MATTIKVSGMTCNHCKASVTEALSKLDGLSDVNVDLLKGEATFEAVDGVDLEKVKEAVRDIGFDAD